MKLPKMTAESSMIFSYLNNYETGFFSYNSRRISDSIVQMACAGCYHIKRNFYNELLHTKCRDEHGNNCIPIIVNKEEICMTQGDVVQAYDEAKKNVIMKTLIEKSQRPNNTICITDRVGKVKVDWSVKQPISVY